ncbi:CDC27 family protein [Lysinibacillus capsici]|uniref:CDC27 family protein n=1 Tax=Lysinibacillus capsici TaxID=2115968 RepID=UPI0021539686|nr:CDC27 family protein [Lysinibacillus capsici]MCR6521321.1 CDC27 family protein [Lysinibacillus capsici]
MTKRKRHVIKHDNVVVFPGAVQTLIREGHMFAENFQYEKAVASFEKAFVYEAGDEFALSAYAFALYELKDYSKTKDVCEQLFSMGTSFYVEIMELYITVCMQLKEYHQVESLISTLLEENVLPQDQIEKFERLKNLNSEVSKNLEKKENAQRLIEEQEYDLEKFRALSPNEQSIRLHRLMDTNVRQLKEPLKEIIECPTIHPFVQSLALILLVEQEVAINVTVAKFNQTKVVNPTELVLPNQLPQYGEIKNILEVKLEQDPSTLEMVQYLMAKHAIVTYPFEWHPFEADDVAYSYIDFVLAMLGNVQEMDYEIIDFLQMLEKLTELH